MLADQGIDAVVATLGILKAGAAYVPLDPQLSHAEIEWLIRAVGARLAMREAQDAFLSLGGDSLAVIRVNNRLHARFACELPLESFFGNRTVGALAAELRARLADTH